MNLLNTFHCNVTGATDNAKTLRWVQLRFNEMKVALREWCSGSRYPGLLLAFKRVKSLVDATIRGGKLVTPISKAAPPLKK